MKTEEYRNWLSCQNYQDNTIGAQMHRTSRVEECYGNLDDLFEKDKLDGLIKELSYSKADLNLNKPNHTKIPFNGNPYNNLASYRDAIRRYRRFCTEGFDNIDESFSFEKSAEIKQEPLDNHRISLEKDMQAALRQNIEQLESGLKITDEGVERSVESGFIDITATDRNSNTVVIELKTGVAGQKAVAQILSYMGDILSEEGNVRGILVASNFDSKAKSAARLVPNLLLQKYSINFNFSAIEGS